MFTGLIGLILTTLPTGPGVLAADYFHGREIYDSHCSICHGPGGRGAFPGTPDFTRGEGLNKPESQLIRHIEFGTGPAPAFRNILSRQDILDVLAYIRGLY